MLHQIDEIYRACREGHVDLLKENVNNIESSLINQSNEEGLSPIHLAVLYNDYQTALSLIGVLLKHGADVNVVDKRSGDSLLHLCLGFKPPEVSKRLIPFLLRRGCDYRIKNYVGKSAVDVAKDNGYVDLESLVREYPHMRHVTDNYNTPVNSSNHNDSESIKPSKGSLIESILSNNITQIKELLDEGVDANDDENTKYMPIHYAVSRGQQDPVTVLKLLENFKARMDSKTEENDTVLTLAIKKIEDEELCLKVIEYLKGCGISTTDTDNDGNDAKTLAMMRHFDRVVASIGSVLDFEGPYHPIHNISRNKNLNYNKKIETLENPYFKNKVPVDLRTKLENETCLHIACRNSDVKLVKYLLEKNAQVRVSNKKGETPLSITRDITKNSVIEHMLIEADKRQNVEEKDQVDTAVAVKKDDEKVPSKQTDKKKNCVFV